MEDEKVLPEEIVITPTETVTLKATKPKKKVEVTRTIEELDNVDPRKMTDKERITYIVSLRVDNQYYKNKANSYQDEAESAYNRVRLTEDDSKRVREQANLKLQQVKDNVRVMANNIMNILEK